MGALIIPDPNYRPTPHSERPCAKRRFDSAALAAKALGRVVARAGRRPSSTAQAPEIFFCDRCQGWHWGHKYTRKDFE